MPKSGHVVRRHVLLARSAPGARPYRPLPRAFELRDNATMYEALYLALAEALEATLLTRDRRLARIPGVAVQVDVVANGA